MAAYNALSPAFAATLDGLQLEHSSLPLAKMAQLGSERSREEGVFTVHPLVIRHPVRLSSVALQIFSKLTGLGLPFTGYGREGAVP